MIEKIEQTKLKDDENVCGENKTAKTFWKSELLGERRHQQPTITTNHQPPTTNHHQQLGVVCVRACSVMSMWCVCGVWCVCCVLCALCVCVCV